MGAIISYYLWSNTGRTDDPDPVTTLTSREKYLIRSSWEQVKKDLVLTSCKVFLAFFKKHPENHKLFPFKDVPIDQLMENKKYQAHCSSVAYSLSQIVDSLDDSALLISILEKIGDSHNRRKIKSKSVDQFKNVALEVFKDVMNEEAVAAWEKALTVSFKVIAKQLQQ